MIQRLIKQLSGQELQTDKLRVAQLIRAMKNQSYYIPPVIHKIRSRKVLGPLAQQLLNTGKSKPVQNVINKVPVYTKPNAVGKPQQVVKPINPIDQINKVIKERQKAKKKY